MLKNKISALFMFATLSVSSMCFASVPDSELYLGGIGVDSTNQEVQTLYGDPWVLETQGKNHALWKGEVKTYEYGKEKTYKVTFNNDKVIQVYSKANNGLETPAGLHVGMDKEDVLDFYGKPDVINEYNGKDKWFYASETNEHKGMVIVIDNKTEKVKEITVGLFE